MCEEQNWHPLQSSKLQVKAEYTEIYPLDYWCPAILSFQTGMDDTLHAKLYASGRPSSGVPVYAVKVSPVASQCGVDSTKFLQWHSSVGLFQLSFSSGDPVWGCFN